MASISDMTDMTVVNQFILRILDNGVDFLHGAVDVRTSTAYENEVLSITSSFLTDLD